MGEFAYTQIVTRRTIRLAHWMGSFLLILTSLLLGDGVAVAQDHHEHELGNFISKHAGAKIYSCSSYDTLSGFKPDGVIDPANKVEGLWRTDIKSEAPHWIIIELPEEQDISTFMFNTGFLQTEGACPRFIMIEFSTEGPTIKYKRIARVTLRPNYEEQIISVETNKARWIRITAYNNWGNIPQTEFGRVYAYNDVEINMIEMILTNEKKLDLRSIKFESASDSIQPMSYPKLEMIAQVIKSHPEWKVKVEGHTDSDGSYRYNMVLSQKRADAVRQVLIDSGLDESKITSKGYGFTQKIEKNEKSDAEKAENRRVVIVIDDGSE